MNNLKGKTAVITGASSGFGKGIARAFAQAGCDLLLIARRESLLKEVKKECQSFGVRAEYFVGDVQKETTAIKSIELAIHTFGKIDILVNNAGIGRLYSIQDTSLEEYDLIMDTNVRSAYAFTKYAVPYMVKQKDGQIILVSSVTGIKGHGNETAYTCSKFALRGFGQALDQELLSQGIRTCVFCPHAGSTEFEIGFGRTKEKISKSGFLTPEDVGQALLTVCLQNKNSRVVELRLASNNVKY